jgi:hypothetical protein
MTLLLFDPSLLTGVSPRQVKEVASCGRLGLRHVLKLVCSAFEH